MQRVLAGNVILLSLIPSLLQASDETKELNSIIVSSQRVERDLSEVPANISVISAENIRDLRAETVSDVVKTLPNVSLQNIPGDYTYFQIRGLPRNLEQSNIPVYVDGVPYTSLYGLNISLLDVEQMELVRGPQGNLYGANARDGLLSITTRKPGNTPEGRLQIGGGNFNYQNTQFVGSMPLITNELFANISLQHRERDGFVNNTFLNQPLDNIKDQVARAGLLWQPNDRFSARLSFDATNRNGGAYTYVPGSPALNDGDDIKTAMNDENILDQNIRGSSLGLDWQLTPDWTLSSVTGLRKIDTFARFDADFSPAEFGVYDTWLDERDAFQELRLASTPGSQPIDWLFGISYFNSQDDNRNEYALFDNQITAHLERDTYTGYANAIWDISPTWTIESGLRYTHETLDMNNHFKNPFYPVPSAVTEGSVRKAYSQWLPKAAQTITSMRANLSTSATGKEC